MSDKFLVIKKYIDEMDYYTLLASGAPSDEFDAYRSEQRIYQQYGKFGL